MSALAGLWNFKGRQDSGEACKRMLTAQQIYGPHDSTSWDGRAVALGRRLFRTLPEDIHDRQPLSGGGGRWVLVADVRLDNRDELASHLGIDSDEARSLCDAAFLLRAWERWEENVFDHLLGDYAFAVWDARDRRLILARDPMGTRPLHYHLSGKFFAFASMPKGLHVLPEIHPAPDEVRAAEFLALIPEYGSRSFFKDISRVEMGQAVVVTPSGLTTRHYWEPRREAPKLASFQDYAEALRYHLDRAVEVRLRGSGGRVGAHLSGGFDSSAVAATAARLLAPGGGRVLAFTAVPRAGYDGPVPAGCIGDESELAGATVSLHPNMEHILVPPDGSALMDDLDRDFFLFERPLINTSVQKWWNSVNAEAKKQKVTVLLTGLMGNPTISYAGMEALPELAARGKWLRLLSQGRALVRTGHARWHNVLAAILGPWVPEPLWNALCRIGRGWQWDIGEYATLNPERRRSLNLDKRASQQGFDLSYRPPKNGFDTRLWVLRRVDWGNNNKGVLGGWGIDMRDPTTDRRLIEFCLSLPAGLYLQDGVPRALGARAFADRLPKGLLTEKRKGMQAIDWHEAMTASRDRLREEISRLEQVPEAVTALNLERMRALVDDWPTGDWNGHHVTFNYRMALLRGIVSGHFLRKASRSNA
jgi:asparagine synthase (glutamine-hydrolysing)